MMSSKRWSGGLLAAALSTVLGAGCDPSARVEKESKELQKAQQNAPKEVKELQRELDQAKSEVVRLEQKMALAKQGVTDDVLEERKELKQALQKQDQHVREEIKEAQGAARELNSNSERARQQLEQTQPPRVETQMKTNTQVTPTGSKVEVTREEVQVPIERTRVSETDKTRPNSAGSSATGTGAASPATH